MNWQARQAVLRVVVQRKPRESIVAFQHIPKIIIRLIISRIIVKRVVYFLFCWNVLNEDKKMYSPQHISGVRRIKRVDSDLRLLLQQVV